MRKNIQGLHHITVLASNPQINYDFYTKILGLRLIKKTVNFDAPEVYHLYYGDEIGTPGTVLTFFPFPGAKRGTRGIGEASIVSFSIPRGSLDFWIQRLRRNDIAFDGPKGKFGNDLVSFLDPDGMRIELVEDDVQHLTGWEIRDLPREYSIKKFFGVTIRLNNSERTENLLKDIFGLILYAESGSLRRFISGECDQEIKFDIQINPDARPAIQYAGSVHHIAWRTENDASQRMWLNTLRAQGYYTTDVIDRYYFHSIYFREPGGILFEIATDGPGFLIDEETDALGEALKLPPMYESRRDAIESNLMPIHQGGTLVAV